MGDNRLNSQLFFCFYSSKNTYHYFLLLLYLFEYVTVLLLNFSATLTTFGDVANEALLTSASG